MAILEVGKDKTFTTVGSAVEAAKNGDEIRISSGSYEEIFDCTKKLTFTGVPLDMNDYTTYPVIDGKKDSIIVVLKECTFCNLIFSADYTLQLDKLNGIDAHKPLEWWEHQDLCKYVQNHKKHQNPYCIGIEASCTFTNCAFIGSVKAAAGIVLRKENQKVVFANCVFYRNSDKALFVNGKAKNAAVVLEDCVINYGDYGIEIDGTGSISMNRTVISNLLEQAVSAGKNSRLIVSDCEILDCGGGMIIIEQSNLLMTDSRITVCGDFGILATDSAEVNVYGCNISENRQDGILLMGKAKASVHDTVLDSNKINGISLCDQANASLYNTEIVHNKNGIDMSKISSIYISKCSVHNNKQCDLQQIDGTVTFAEKTSFHNNGMEFSYEEPYFVSVIIAKEADVTFQECEFSAEQNEDVKLIMSADNSKVVYKDCIFHDAEDGAGVFDNSQCSFDSCKFARILNLEIIMMGDKDSKLRVCDTKLNKKTMAQFRVG